jgi:hypothetical protein
MTREVVRPGLLAVTIGGHEEYLTRHDLRIARRQIEKEDGDGYARVRGLRLDESQLAELESDVGAPSPTRLGIHGVCEAHAAMADVATPVVTEADLARWRTETVEPHVACTGCTYEAVSA